MANLTNVTGVSTKAYTYDAFGNIVKQSGSSTNDNQFLTKETDSSGLVYFGARYYDPRVGRFITPDPMGMIDGPNLYLYADNDPINLMDLWGLCGEPAFKQFLENLSKYSTVVATALTITGQEHGALIFWGISAGTTGLEISIYETNKITQTIKEVIKASVGKVIGDSGSILSDEIIDNLFKNSRKTGGTK